MDGCALLWTCGRWVSEVLWVSYWGVWLIRTWGGRYQNSVGSARKVVRLLEEHDKGLKKGAKL